MRIKAAQIRQLPDQAQSGMVGAAVAAVVLSAALWNVVPHIRIVAWLTIYLVVQIPRYGAVREIRRGTLDDEETLRQGRRLILLNGLNAGMWGVGSIALFPDASFTHQCLLAVFLAGIAASTTMAHAAVTESLVPSALLPTLPICFRFFLEGTETHVILGCVGLVFSGALLATARSVHILIRDAIRLRFEKDDLVDELRESSSELERRVSERTAELTRSNEDLKQEVAERLRAEIALRRSEERFRELVDLLPEIVFEADDQGRLTFLNRTGYEALGYSDPDLERGLTVLDLTALEDKEYAAHTLAQTMKGQSGGIAEYRALRKDGGRFPVFARSAPIYHDGRVSGVRGVIVDVGEKQAAEDRLRRSERRYRELYGNLRDGVASVDETGRIVDFNPAFEEMLGYSAEELRRLTYEEITPEKWRNREAKIIREQVFKRSYSDVYEKEYIRKDGGVFPVEVRAYLRFDDEGRRAGMWAFVRDVSERRESEAALKEREALFRTVFQTSPDAVNLNTMNDGRYVDVNEGFVNLSGYDRERIIGKTPDEVGIWKDRDAQKRFLDLLRKDGRVRNFEADFIVGDGSAKTGLVSSNIIELNSGPHVLSVTRDIDDWKKTVRELRENRQRLDLALMGADLGLWDCNLQTGELSFDQVWADTLGYAPNEIEPRIESWEAVVHPDDKAAVSEAFRKHLKHVTPVFEIEHRVRAKSGEWKWILVRGRVVQQDESGKPTRAAGTYLDVTERRRLREERDRLFNLSRDMLAIAGFDGFLRQINPAWTETLGWLESELLEQPLITFVHPEDRTGLEGSIETLRAGEPVFAYENRCLCSDETYRWISWNLIPVAEEQLIYAVGRNVTEARRLEEQVRQAAKMDAIGRLAGGVAHDFNNQLTAIMGFASMLSEQLPSDTPEYDKLLQINRAAESAAELTGRLLAFGRKQLLEVRVLDLNEVLGDLETFLRRLIGEDIEFVTLLEVKGPRVEADPGKLEQIVVNLAVNARDAMPTGGKLTLETATAYLGERYADMHPDVEPGAYAVISVTDSGTGMDTQTVSRIFDPFFTTKPKGEGAGLGLSTVYGLVKQHNGHITVYSEPGQGTTFRVYLPKVEAETDHPAEQRPVQQLPGGSETVLAVEDEEILRGLAHEVLDLLGYRTFIAADPLEALELAEAYEGRIDLLLTDVVLPHMDGKTLYERLTKTRPDVRVIYMSGYTDNAIVHHGVLERGVHFLQKPFTMERLAVKIREVLDAD